MSNQQAADLYSIRQGRMKIL